jgi:PKHD-type hydroxylase
VLYRFPERIENAGAGTASLQWRAGEHPFETNAVIETNSAVNEVFVLPSALSVEECTRAMALGESCKSMKAEVERGHTVDYRASTIAWIEPQPAAHWLYHRIAGLFLEANGRYRFDVSGLVDALQYTVYGPEGLFDWHADVGSGATSARKLSLSLLLNGEAEYEGGRLEFMNVGRGGDTLPAGTAVFFPSYMVHRVSAIARGTRRSLVAWGYGPPFR